MLDRRKSQHAYSQYRELFLDGFHSCYHLRLSRIIKKVYTVGERISTATKEKK